MDIKKVLKQFNLETKEANVYLASLELGASTAQNIAKKAGVTRTYFYDLAEKLLKIGLLKQMKKGNKKLFFATEPEQLLEMKEKQLEDLKEAIPQLKAIYNTLGQKPKVFYYEGRDGIDKINDDTLRYKGEIVAFTTPRFAIVDQQKLSKEYIKRRVALGNRARVIGEYSKEMLGLKKRDPVSLRETKLLPRDVYNSEVEIGIYGNRVSIIDYKEEFGFIIEGNEIAKVLKMIFEIVWNSGKMTR